MQDLIGIRAAIAQFPARFLGSGRDAQIQAERDRGAIESASYIGARSRNDCEKSVGWNRRHPKALRNRGNGHGLPHEFFKGGQARLDGILRSVTAGEGIGGFQAITRDAEHGFFVGAYAPLCD